MYKLEEAGSCTGQLSWPHGTGAGLGGAGAPDQAGQTSWELVRKINISWGWKFSSSFLFDL